MVWALLVGAALAGGSEPSVGCQPILAASGIWRNSRVAVVPGEPWCIQIGTPGKGTLSVEFFHTGGQVARWSLEVRADDGSILKTVDLDEPDPRKARIMTDLVVGPDHDQVTVTLVGSGHAFDITVSFNPIPPTIAALQLPNGSPADSVVRGEALVLLGQDFADDPRTMVHAGGVRVPPDEINADRITFRIPARAYEGTLFVEGPSGTSNRLPLPLADPDPGPAFGAPYLPELGQVSVELFADPHWSAEELRTRVDASLAGCGLATDWKVRGHALIINLHNLHLVVPSGREPAAYGQSVVRCLAAGLDIGVGGLVVGVEKP